MKFVIHHHITEPEHYDLMLEKGEILHTWQIPMESFQNFLKGKQVQVEKIQDHRKKYLDYEGPISCDRGMVKIFDTGDYAEKLWGDEIIVATHGNFLKGTLALKADDGFYLLLLNG